MGILTCLFGDNERTKLQLASIKIGGNRQDYHLGLEVQTADKPMISWDTTYDEMLALPFVKQIYQDNHRKTFCFTIPVRLGNFLIDNLQFYYQKDNRTDMAVGSYGVYVDNLPNAKQLYQEIKNQLSQDWQFDDELSYQNRCYFKLNELSIQLHYTDEKCVEFYLENNKEYPLLLVDNNGESQLTISDFVLIDEPCRWYASYKYFAFVKRRPPIITERFGDKAVCWRDDKKGVFGFSANEFSVQISLKTLKIINIDRTLPYRGGGIDELYIKFFGEKFGITLTIFECGVLDNYHHALEKLIGKNIDIRDNGRDYG